jgi:cell division protein ZapA
MAERAGERKTVTVEIGGERHVLRSDASPEYTQSVAAHVDATIRALGAGNMLDPYKVAVLAALTITDELFRTRGELSALREEIIRRSSRVAYLLERAAEGARDPVADGDEEAAKPA